MANRPILFSGPMVRALLSGTKTQTRRLPSFSRYRGFTEFGPSDTKGYDWHLRDSGMRWHDLRHSEVLGRLPWHYGDRLYVREHWFTWGIFDDLAPSKLTGKEGVSYIADGVSEPRPGKFRQGMHMPRWASRITLTVTDVRVERLQDISVADAVAEGALASSAVDQFAQVHAIPMYRAIWTGINGDGSWGANPWVAAYTFTVAMGNIDELARAA
jgi:hypothetical protein